MTRPSFYIYIYCFVPLTSEDQLEDPKIFGPQSPAWRPWDVPVSPEAPGVLAADPTHRAHGELGQLGAQGDPQWLCNYDVLI